jgi:hypothetical protein
VQPECNEAVSNSAQQLTKLQDHFLDRLQFFLNRKAELRQIQHSDVHIMKALDKAIYSTYLDCVEQGVGEDAKAILRAADRPAKV